MSKNQNEQSKHIVRSWFDRADTLNNNHTCFDRFISLWISFNCFFVAEQHLTAKENSKRKGPQERDYLDAVIKNGPYSELYNRLIGSDTPFKNSLQQLLRLINGPEHITHFDGKIADMRPDREQEKYAQEFTDITSFKQFILSAYRIRCNLFHGKKNPDVDAEKELVEAMFKPLISFLKELYRQERYLNRAL